jgi:hypothetical protein
MQACPISVRVLVLYYCYHFECLVSLTQRALKFLNVLIDFPAWRATGPCAPRLRPRPCSAISPRGSRATRYHTATRRPPALGTGLRPAGGLLKKTLDRS